MITGDVAAMAQRLGIRDAWLAPLQSAMIANGVTTPKRAAAFLATIYHESAGLTRLVESLNYTPDGLRATWPSRFDAATAARLGRVVGRVANQAAIAERAYAGRMGNNQPGDGWRYRGRGLVQLTGRENYRRHGLEETPEVAAMPDAACRIAAEFWRQAGCNALADRGDIAGWRKAINGGDLGLAEVTALYHKAITKR